MTVGIAGWGISDRTVCGVRKGMAMTSKRWVHALVLAACADSVLEVVEFRSTTPGSQGSQWLAILALGCDVLVVVSVIGVVLSFRAAWAELYRHRQVETASGALSSDWLWETDRDWRIRYSSPGVEELLGYGPAELVGRSTDDMVLGDARARSQAQTQTASADGWRQREADWRHKDGSLVRLVGSAMPIHDRRGRLVGYRGTRRLAETPGTATLDLAHASRRLTSALERDEMDVALQPIVSLVDGTIAGVEALARFHDRQSPDTWFREAARLGRERELDEHMFDKALALLDAVPDTAYLSINASPDLIADPGFRRRLLARRLPLDRIVIEITEHARVSDYDALRSAVSSLREHRVKFAIDDTGAGYASLNHVLQLRPDVIKLDRDLLGQLNDDPARRSLVTALVLLAMDIGATVTGEGVESAAQLEALAMLGVEQVQGYFLARPTTEPTCWSGWWDKQWLPDRPVVGLGLELPKPAVQDHHASVKSADRHMLGR
jgi:PAS domain S-box-containing protein